MYDYMLPMSNRGIISVAKRAFDLVDARLMGHGQRVASIMYQLMKADGGYDGRKMRDMLTLAVLHDIGAYKTEEIDKMVEFETENVWNHSIYGYLFFYYFSLLKELSGIVLYHHTPWNVLRRMDHVPDHIKKASQLLHLADRIDIYFEHSAGDVDWLKQYLGTQRDQNFCGEVLDLFEGMDFVAPGSSSLFLEHEYIQIMEEVPFSSREKQSILRMLVYAIDFRSTHTVTHTITTTIISSELALRLCERADTINDVIFGAMLHDLGKIGIPVEILEFPGRLSPQAMNVMRGHVKMTEYILQDCVSDAVRDIALRHHEKLDGSGYPLGLKEGQLNLPQRIVAVADIVSALTGTRSYKDAYSKEKTSAIVSEMAEKGLVDPGVAAVMVENYDAIMDSVRNRTRPILEKYQEMQEQYKKLSHEMREYMKTL